MKIILKKLIIKNFKGCVDRTIEFAKNTNIIGDNATGKTTIADALFWLLFNKNSLGDEKFKVRPLDKFGNYIDNVEISVYGVFEVDGKQVTLKKNQKQKWVKKRGSDVAELQGNENLYEIQEIPKSEKEYKEYIDTLIKEEVFKLITNPQAFVSKKWKEQREILLKMVTEINDMDVVAIDERFKALVADLQQFTIEDLLKRESKPMSEWKKRQDVIPALIDEVYKSIVDVDLSALELQKNSINEQIAEIESMEENGSKAYAEIDKLRSKIMELQFKQSEISQKANNELQGKRRELRIAYESADQHFKDIHDRQSTLLRTIDTSNAKIEALRKERQALLDEWHKVNDMAFNEDSLICSYCGQLFTEDKQAEVKASFEDNKKANLDRIVKQGIGVKASIEETEKSISNMQKEVNDIKEDKIHAMAEINRIKAEMESLPNEADLSANEEHMALVETILELNKQIESTNTGADYRQQLRIKKSGLKEELAMVERKLAAGVANERAKDRIEELKTEQKELAQKVADQEKKIFLLEEFNRAKMELISSNINSLFKVVTFKLFENQINGGYKETCECMVNGVPYSDLNNAAKIQAGLDIIGCLQKFHNSNAPIIIDNRESVSVIPDIDSQIINLIVPAKEISADKVITL